MPAPFLHSWHAWRWRRRRTIPFWFGLECQWLFGRNTQASCAVLVFRHWMRRHTRLNCCGWTRLGRRGVTSVRGRDTIGLAHDGPATEPSLDSAGQVYLELLVVRLLKHFEGCCVLIVKKTILVSVALKIGATAIKLLCRRWEALKRPRSLEML